jgi:hypothetical protein
MWKAAPSFLTLCLHTIRLWWALRCDGSAKQLLQQLALQLAGAEHLLCSTPHQLWQGQA